MELISYCIIQRELLKVTESKVGTGSLCRASFPEITIQRSCSFSNGSYRI